MSKIYYHGSNQKFDKFDKSKIKENKLGLCFNFTDDIDIAYQYGDNIIKANLDLKNPLTLDLWDKTFPYEWYNKFGKLFCNEPDYEYNKEVYEKHPWTFGDMFNTYKMEPDFIKILEEMGYDGIAIPEDHHFGVFEPEQIHIIHDNIFNKLDEELSKYILDEQAWKNACGEELTLELANRLCNKNKSLKPLKSASIDAKISWLINYIDSTVLWYLLKLNIIFIQVSLFVMGTVSAHSKSFQYYFARILICIVSVATTLTNKQFL